MIQLESSQNRLGERVITMLKESILTIDDRKMSAIEFRLRSKLPFMESLFLKIRIGPSSRKYNMWFEVIGRDGDAYVIANPHYFRGNGSREQIIVYPDDSRIVNKKWYKYDDLLAPPPQYNAFIEGCKKSNYYPDDFVTVYRM